MSLEADLFVSACGLSNRLGDFIVKHLPQYPKWAHLRWNEAVEVFFANCNAVKEYW